MPHCPHCQQPTTFAVPACGACGKQTPWAIGLPYFQVRADRSREAGALSLSIIADHQNLEGTKSEIDKWYQDTRQAIVRLHFMQAATGLDGPLSDYTWHYLRHIISTELGKFKTLRDQIQARNDRLWQEKTSKILGRLANMGRCTYENMRVWRSYENGDVAVKRVLSGTRCCKGCRAQAALKWVPIPQMVPLGYTEKDGDCDCIFVTSATYKGWD